MNSKTDLDSSVVIGVPLTVRVIAIELVGVLLVVVVVAAAVLVVVKALLWDGEVIKMSVKVSVIDV